MRFRALLRSSAALPLLPVALTAAAFYYFVNGRDQVLYFPIPTAPMLVAAPIEMIYAVAYGVAAATGAWQGARVRADGVWLTAPLRRSLAVVATSLAPVVSMVWLMFLIPVVAAFLERPTMPTWDSLPPLILGLTLSVAWALLGFTIGQRVNPILAAPILACGVFFSVASMHARDAFFLRHMSGEYLNGPGFGESATIESIVAQMLPTVGVAIAVALLWTRIPRLIALVVGVVVVLVSSLTSYSIVKDWDYNPSLNAGKVALACTGTAPRVCLPEQASEDLDQIHSEVQSAYSVLTTYGVAETVPNTVTERTIYGRFEPSDEDGKRYAYLLQGNQNGSVAAAMIMEEVRFGCDADPLTYRVAQLWLGKKLGLSRTFESYAGEDPYYTRSQHRRLLAEVDAVSAKRDDAQRAWFGRIKVRACEEAE